MLSQYFNVHIIHVSVIENYIGNEDGVDFATCPKY
jgi:hypothetical protein